MISIKFFHNFFLACAAVPPSRPSFQILNAKKSCGKLPANNAQQLPQPFFSFMQNQLGWLPSAAAH